MAWFFDPSELRRRREELGLSPKEAADLVGVSLSTLYRHEQPAEKPLTVQSHAKQGYERVYGIAATESPPQKTRVPSPSASAIARERVATEEFTFNVLTADVLRDCTTAPGLFTGKRYAVIGRIDEHDEVPEQVTRTLRAKAGTAARFHLDSGIDGPERFGVTVFARVAEHARLLLEYARRPEKITVIVYVLVKPIADAFLGFQSLGPIARCRPFAFVVEQIIAG